MENKRCDTIMKNQRSIYQCMGSLGDLELILCDWYEMDEQLPNPIFEKKEFERVSNGLGDKSNSQFFTPYHVCELMAKVTEEDVAAVVKEKGYITINDFCCGAGATLIAAINEARKQLEKVNLNFQNHVLVVAQDIDEIVALMCYIQLSLLGVAAYIKVGDVFTQPMSTDDNGENYWFTMMYFSDVWTMRRVFHSL